MEKFTFTLEQIKYLYDACKKGEHIFVNGKNGIGENFFTCAKIYANEKGEPIINTDFIFLRFGEEVGGDLIYAPFHLNVEERTNVDDQLVIESITDKEGNIIYFNKEFSKSNKIFVENGTRIRANNKQITSFDPVTKNIFRMVGKPVMLERQHGVFVTLLGVNEHGNPMVVLLNGGGNYIVEIHRDSTLFTEDENGIVRKVADNKDENCVEIFKTNKHDREL